ncbi:hypothetical protein GA0115255_104041 [Streptomyces sp. Ncost-T6T-2b]|nr:hypothetical protein GA0115255_104041 [Streptomyces sp. Ncost-T6T-2b]
MEESTAPFTGQAKSVDGFTWRMVSTVVAATVEAFCRWLSVPVTALPRWAMEARSGSANGSAITLPSSTTFSRAVSHCLATVWFLPGTVVSPDSTSYFPAIAATLARRSGSMTQVTGSLLPRATICSRRPPGASSLARSSSVNTGVCCSSERVSAVTWGEAISGQRKVSFVLLSVASGCQGRNERSMPSTCS